MAVAKKTTVKRAAKKSAKKTASVKKAGTQHRWTDDVKLKVVAKENPCVGEKKAAFKMFELLKKKHTVGAAIPEAEKLMGSRNRAISYLRLWASKGFVKPTFA
jgi:hypothetical protein